MRRSLTKSTVIAIVALMIAGLLLPGAAFGATKVKTSNDTTPLEEGWYYRYRQPLEPVPDAPGDTGDPLPTQQDNVKAQVRQRSNPYEAETLHVGINGTQPEARTFLYWDPFSLSDTGLATIIGGTVTLPLVETRGVRNAENAKMLACLNIDLPTSDLAGEWKEQPKFDCKTSAPVKQVKGSDPITWTVDLDVFGALWKKDPTKYAGIAIVEDPKAPESPQTAEWHVAFAGQFNETKGVKKVTADLKYEVEEFDFVLPPVPTFEQPPTTTTGGGGFSDTGGGFEDDAGFGSDNSVAAPGGAGFGGPVDTGPPPAQVAAVDPGPAPAPAEPVEPALAAPAATGAAQPLAAQPASQRDVKNPFGYWLLPILGLALAGAVGWSLSHPVELVNVREGAVSRLMRARADTA